MKERKLFVWGTENELPKLPSKQLAGSARAPGADEISNLLAILDRDLAACQMKQLLADWRCALVQLLRIDTVD